MWFFWFLACCLTARPDDHGRKAIKKRVKKYSLQDLRRELEALGVDIDKDMDGRTKRTKKELQKLLIQELRRLEQDQTSKETYTESTKTAEGSTVPMDIPNDVKKDGRKKGDRKRKKKELQKLLRQELKRMEQGETSPGTYTESTKTAEGFTLPMDIPNDVKMVLADLDEYLDKDLAEMEENEKREDDVKFVMNTLLNEVDEKAEESLQDKVSSTLGKLLCKDINSHWIWEVALHH